MEERGVWGEKEGEMEVKQFSQPQFCQLRLAQFFLLCLLVFVWLTLEALGPSRPKENPSGKCCFKMNLLFVTL